MYTPRTPRFPANAIQAPKYAVCKHGFSHSHLCGYAHKLAELGMPLVLLLAMWHCTAHVHRGHAGIDMFFGQAYTGAQYDRVIQMVHAEGLAGIPAWARLFAYFVGYGA